VLLENWVMCQVGTTNFGPFEVLEKIGSMAYRLAFPPSVKFHVVFYVSFPKRYVHDANHVLDWYVLQVEKEGVLQPEPQCILEWRQLTLQS